MPRDLPLGNGSMLVTFDASHTLRDVYFPHVGQENHTLGKPSRLGIWADGQLSWLDSWGLQQRYQSDTLVTDVVGHHPHLQLRVRLQDAVDYCENLLIRRVTLTDESGRDRAVRVFAHFDANIGESPFANGAYFDGAHQALICYKGDRYFLLGSLPPIAQYAVGTKGSEQHQGTWRDAEDGNLSNHPIASGYVDATLMFELALPAHGEASGHTWLAAGTAVDEVLSLHQRALLAPGAFLARTAAYWRFWLRQARQQFGDLSPAAGALYRRSLLIVRTQIDNNGAVIAANDSDIAQFGMDHYSYIWPRDAALVIEALDMAGYHEAPRRFFALLRQILTQTRCPFEGYLPHRYTPTGLLAASWHPGVAGGRLQLPIQEDETALVLHSLWCHVEATGDVELVRDLYEVFVRPAADFLLIFRDQATGLPQPSHDLWEEKYGVFLFTCASVYAALRAAAACAEALGLPAAASYAEAADEVRAGVATHFYDPQLGRFVFMVHMEEDGTLRRDPTLDSSMAGVFLFDLFPATDPRVVATMLAVQAGLQNRSPIGGIARHGNDYYHHIDGDYAHYQGNTWFVSTLWLADWFSACGDRGAAATWIEWCAEHALPSGVLVEQLHPYTGQPLSVSPLTWSHAAYVASVERYMAIPARK